MHCLVTFTLGTSFLTNQIEDKDPGKLILGFNKTANWTQEKIGKSSDSSNIFSQITVPVRNRLDNKLNNNNVLGIPEMSAKLNGICELYDEQLSKGNQDIYFIIVTDTPQRLVTL